MIRRLRVGIVLVSTTSIFSGIVFGIVIIDYGLSIEIFLQWCLVSMILLLIVKLMKLESLSIRYIKYLQVSLFIQMAFLAYVVISFFTSILIFS